MAKIERHLRSKQGKFVHFRAAFLVCLAVKLVHRDSGLIKKNLFTVGERVFYFYSDGVCAPNALQNSRTILVQYRNFPAQLKSFERTLDGTKHRLGLYGFENP